MKGPTQLQIHLRYVRYLLWEFRWPLSVFTSVVLAAGLLFHLCYHSNGRPLGYVEACYGVFLLIFLEANLSFPDEWYLQPLFFLLPVIGLGAVADSIVRLAYLVFAKRSKLQEWQRMVASLYSNHVIVMGVGKVGFLIIKGLTALRENVVAIERDAESPLLDEVLEMGVPVIRGNGRQPKSLEQAGIARARAIILATSDDLANLDAALTARDLNARVQVVLRLFDDTLATKFAGAFSMPAISTASVAAPAFIAAATNRKVYHDFELSGKPVHLTDVTVLETGGLVGRAVGEVQRDADVNIVMHSGGSGVKVNPAHDLVLAAGDSLLVIATMDRLLGLESTNRGQG
ncbi:MAG TPA: NAD-binding protein [Pirellulales bacterium]|jgi:Trk K+ transport system NAD-binding subunit|nr:NAD-binding protein [Pirellulales bacterium]